jgi:hypothetical protein
MESMSILHDRLDERDIQNFNYSSEPKKNFNKDKRKRKFRKLILIIILIFSKSNNEPCQYYPFNKFVIFVIKMKLICK